MSVGLPAIEFASFGNLLRSRDALGATGIDADDIDVPVASTRSNCSSVHSRSP
jgi:hypothetical protein